MNRYSNQINNLETLQPVYAFCSVGGALAGTVSLDLLPDGEYQVVMYSSNNKKMELSAMLYQFQ